MSANVNQRIEFLDQLFCELFHKRPDKVEYIKSRDVYAVYLIGTGVFDSRTLADLAKQLNNGTFTLAVHPASESEVTTVFVCYFGVVS